MSRSPLIVLLAAASVLVPLAALRAQEPMPEAKEWVRKLRTSEWPQRMEAAEMLGYIGDPATLSDFAEVLSPYPPPFSEKVAEALGRMGGPRALRVLTTLIKDRYLLQGYQWEAFRQLGEAVGRIDHKDRAEYALMRNRYEKGCQYSEGKSEDAMLFCMAWYGDEKAVGALVNMMKTGSPERQHLVADRLGEIGNKKSDEELCMLVDYSEDKKLKQIAAMSLGRRHAKLAVESLRDVLSKDLELEASQALGMIGDKEAVADLRPLLMHKDPAVKLNAAFALARLGDKSGVETAGGLVASTDKLVAAKAAATLLAALDESGLAKLKEAWAKLNAKERYWFIKDNLEGDAWAAAFLKDVAAGDKYPGTKRAAAEATAGK